MLLSGPGRCGWDFREWFFQTCPKRKCMFKTLFEIKVSSLQPSENSILQGKSKFSSDFNNIDFSMYLLDDFFHLTVNAFFLLKLFLLIRF